MRRSDRIITPADEGMAAARRENAELSDDENPMFIFNMTSTSLLRKAMREEIDLQLLAREELINRHLDPDEHLY